MNDFGLPRVRVSMTPADVLVAPFPEDICWIRCWAAGNACSPVLCLCRACTASFSRLTNLASNSSMVVMMYCREPKNHEELCVKHGQGQHEMEQTQYMDGVERHSVA